MADLVAAAAQDGDVERVDAGLEQHLGAGRAGAAGEVECGLGRGIRLADEALEGPVAAANDIGRDAGERGDAAERAATARECEGRHVVLHAGVVTGKGRGAQQVHRTVRADEPATGGRGRGQDHE